MLHMHYKAHEFHYFLQGMQKMIAFSFQSPTAIWGSDMLFKLEEERGVTYEVVKVIKAAFSLYVEVPIASPLA